MNGSLELRRYRTRNDRVPFTEWLQALDASTAGRVMATIDRMKAGRWGNWRPVGHGVAELKIDFGPGYRAYYLRDGARVIILLCGGDKSTQAADIRRAHAYAADYWSRR